MTIRFSAPSKTFLSGEYAVLVGAPALVLCTGPRFELMATREGEASVAGIPAGSPAAKWLEQRSPLLREWRVEFRDPHAGRGGFGASSAQFLFVHALTTFLQVSVARAVEGLDLPALWNDFRVLSGGKASGADVLAQALGQVARVEDGKATHGPWPFPELSFAIVRTGHKIATHSHLAELGTGPFHALREPARECAAAFAGASAEKFLLAARVYADGLRALGLQSPYTMTLLDAFAKQSWCKLAKGCGALGADTVLVMFATEDRAQALESIAAQGLEIGATDLDEGLRMTWSWE